MKQISRAVKNYDIINKFNYKNTQNIPYVKKIILNFTFKKCTFQELLSTLVALELISIQKAYIIKSKVSNISLKIRKGTPIGCKVTLRKTNMKIFLMKLIDECFNAVRRNKNITHLHSYSSFTLKNVLFFKDLEKNYLLFKNLPNLNIYIALSSKTKDEINFLLKEYKLL